jgi:hypothetical protein
LLSPSSFALSSGCATAARSGGLVKDSGSHLLFDRVQKFATLIAFVNGESIRDFLVAEIPSNFPGGDGEAAGSITAGSTAKPTIRWYKGEQ